MGKGKHDALSNVMELSDGRLLAYISSGSENPTNGTIIFLHGHPGTRMEVQCTSMTEHLVKENMRLITFDRPGSGFSHHKPGYQVKDIVPDILELADHLNTQQFVVGGGEGGGGEGGGGVGGGDGGGGEGGGGYGTCRMGRVS